MFKKIFAINMDLGFLEFFVYIGELNYLFNKLLLFFIGERKDCGVIRGFINRIK